MKQTSLAYKRTEEKLVADATSGNMAIDFTLSREKRPVPMGLEIVLVEFQDLGV
jgi:hypothetical protein